MAVYFGVAQVIDPYSLRKPTGSKAEPAGTELLGEQSCATGLCNGSSSLLAPVAAGP